MNSLTLSRSCRMINLGAFLHNLRQTPMMKKSKNAKRLDWQPQARLIPVALTLIWSLQVLIADPVRDLIGRNVVTFIFQVTETNSFPIGTGFFVAIPAKADPKVSFAYLVTAKHVLFDTNGHLPSHIAIRMNATATNEAFCNLQVFFTGPEASQVFIHPDKSVDVAVIPLFFDFKRANITGNPVKQLAERESFRHFSIREGDEMFFLGLFTPFIGSKQNIPIYRFGRLAMLSEERIPFGQQDDEDLLLMETQVFGGNSGAPCFFYFDERRAPGDAKVILAGVVKGYFQDWSEVRFVNTKQTPISSEHVGISAVIPAYYILDILQCEGLQASRTLLEQQLSSGRTTNTTSATPAK